MGFIHNDAVHIHRLKIVAMLFAFDVVQTHHEHRKLIDDRFPVRHGLFQPSRRPGRQGFRLNVEVTAEFRHPLIHEVRGAQHRKPIDFPAIHHFPHDESGFNRFTDTDIVGDEQPHNLLPHRHQKRHQLIGAGLHGNGTE